MNWEEKWGKVKRTFEKKEVMFAQGVWRKAHDCSKIRGKRKKRVTRSQKIKKIQITYSKARKIKRHKRGGFPGEKL